MKRCCTLLLAAALPLMAQAFLPVPLSGESRSAWGWVVVGFGVCIRWQALG